MYSKNDFMADYLKIKNYLLSSLEILSKARIFGRINIESVLKDEIERDKKRLEELLINIADVSDYLFNVESNNCIEEFVNTEMDYKTDGIRGIGRMSNYIPRFGGYYSKFLCNTSYDEIEIIRNLLKDIIKYGYFLGVYAELEDIKSLKLPKNPYKLLFEKWIPQIYVANFSKSPNLDNEMLYRAKLSYYYFCIKIGKETNFPKKFLQIENVGRDKLVWIFRKYIEAGYLLRFFEVQ